MSGKLLTRDEDLRLVSESFFALTHVALPLEYLKRGTVQGWSVGGRLAAAFACITRPPYRVLSLLRADQLDDHLTECLQQGQVCELNGLFIRPEFKAGLDLVAFVKAVLRSFLDTGTSCALFGYNTERDNLAALYQRPFLSPVPLWDGPIVLPDGFVSVSNAFIGYLRADHIARSLRVRRVVCAGAA
jgi:hypothetical protein